jgi:phage shock protein A
MGIFGKFVDIIKSNINDMIDKAEDPAKMVKLMIIEMEEAATKATSSVAGAMANEKNLQRKEEQAKAEALSWQEKAAKALKAGREDLAKEALAKKVNYDNQAKQFEQMRLQSEKTTQQLRQQLDAIKQKLEEARMREATLIARSESAKAQKEFAKNMGNMNNSAFAKFDKMEEKIMKQEAEAEALGELTGANLKEDEFAKLEKNTQVDDELAKLKQQLNK